MWNIILKILKRYSYVPNYSTFKKMNNNFTKSLIGPSTLRKVAALAVAAGPWLKPTIRRIN